MRLKNKGPWACLNMLEDATTSDIFPLYPRDSMPGSCVRLNVGVRTAFHIISPRSFAVVNGYKSAECIYWAWVSF